jgi:hypothetical protein
LPADTRQRQPTNSNQAMAAAGSEELTAHNGQLIAMSRCTDQGRLDWQQQREPERNMRDQWQTKDHGKLQLAAIVHYNSLERLGVRSRPESARHDDGSGSSSDVQQKGATSTRAANGQQQVAAGEDNSHVEVGDVQDGQRAGTTSSKPIGRLGRLFFIKSAGKKKTARSRNGSDLIDNSPPPAAAKQRQASQLDHDMQPKYSSHNESSSANPSVSSGRAERSQVIEFKFDLIVEGDRETSPSEERPDEDVGRQNDAPPAGANSSTPAAEILRPIRQRKLLDNVNELVESFVLDSMDVCLLTVGRRRLQLGRRPAAGADQFDYLLKCAELSLTYAFQLLEATKSVSGTGGGGACSPLRAEAHSIELEAIMFEQHPDGSPMLIVDLLSETAATATTTAYWSDPAANVGQTSFCECSSACKALEALELVRLRANRRASDDGSQRQAIANDDGPKNLTLMVNLKLKQQVNGGNFTNRMCLLDISEPRTSDLAAIVESIFSGQALAHLKKQKARLRLLEMQMTEATTNSDSTTATTTTTPTTNNKHHHQVASLTKLIRAEWLIYKQLSSALIKTLAIVHCHRLSPEEAARQAADLAEPGQVSVAMVSAEDRLVVERHLMDYNLGLLEFARALRRASAMRLKRRKRRLRSHLAKSNLSLVSDTNISVASSTDRPVHDLMISSPFRHRASRLTAEAPAACANRKPEPDCCKEHHVHQHDWQSATMRLHHHYGSYSRHYRHRRGHHRDRHAATRHHNHHHHNHHHHHHHPHHQHHIRAASLNRRDSAATAELDVPDSISPISTPSSGDNRNHRNRLISALNGYFQPEPPAHLRLPSVSGRLTRFSRASSLASCSGGLATTGGPKRSLAIESDPDDSVASLASTSLLSSRSTSRRLAQVPGSISDPKTRRRLQQLQADSHSDSNTIDDAIELQSFSSSIAQYQQAVRPDACRWPPEASLQPDNASDTCSMVVAEPPRQLRLEEFLNRLTNFIEPRLAAATQNQSGDSTLEQEKVDEVKSSAMNPQNEDDDEDCKSHSSILEHLSSLTLESNLKMVKQQQQQQQQQQQERSGSERVSIVADGGGCKIGPVGANGHLQQLLKSTIRMQQKKQQQGQNDLADQLRALTIDCNALSEEPKRPLLAHNVILGDIHPASIGSSCASSSSASSSSSSCSRNPIVSDQRTLDQMYASVIRHHSGSQIKMP